MYLTIEYTTYSSGDVTESITRVATLERTEIENDPEQERIILTEYYHNHEVTYDIPEENLMIHDMEVKLADDISFNHLSYKSAANTRLDTLYAYSQP